MIQLMVAVEGNTERNFIKHVLGPHLLDRQVYVLEPTIVGKLHAQRRGSQKRGGGPFRFWREDLERILRGDGRHDLRVTTLFDLYGLPRDFPGLDEHRTDTNTNRRCDALQAKLAEQFDDRRFIPYLQRHEFEALVLASLPSLRGLLDAEDDLVGLEQLAANIAGTTPEDINDGKLTAPSKRLLRYVPGYSKVLHGPLAVEETGLASLREECPRFDAWVERLETLNENP